MFNRARSYSFFLLISFGLTMIGCAKYTPHPLQKPVSKIEEKEDVKVSTTLLTEKECRHYFSRKMITKGYQPIQICIRNNSDQGYTFDAQRVNAELEDRDAVAKALHLDTAKRIAPYAIAGLFFGVFFIPAIVEGVKSHQANKRLDEDFAQRVISSNSRVFIAPGSVLNRVMFIRSENMTTPLTIDLVNRKTKEKLNFVLHA